jgi:hypothetical protein
MLRKTTFFLMASLITLTAFAGTGNRGFAVIIDSGTYAACTEEIEAYRSLLREEGFQVILLAREWRNPREVKDELLTLYRNNGLEGAVFIGQIPIPMIRDAQHFTSAFKMDQERYPMHLSSVPSDRYYDDFDLRFDDLKQDSIKSLFHYYSLRWDSPQHIGCDIYTGRIKPTREGEEGYSQIRRYFRKLITERQSENPLDVIVSYTGEGSFSNSLTAWKEEGITMREQFPGAFKNGKSAKFLIFAMAPYMKETIAQELKREDVDLMLFHEHGTADRQYITGIPESTCTEEYAEAARRLFRNRIRREMEKKGDIAELKQEWMKYYQIDSTWFAGALDTEQMEKDSLSDAITGILLEDVAGMAPNPRVVIFDACFNGDFREDRYIAGEYIFSGGRTLVSIANSVNVLQDKSSSDLLGLLGLGYSVGEWAMLTNILESHIIGDPTFCFSRPEGIKKLNLHSVKSSYWLKIFRNSQHPDIKGVALHKLHDLRYPKLPGLLTETYRNSGSYMLRLQVFHLLQHYNSDKFETMLRASLRDPYEFIRRKSVYAMGRIGKDELIPDVASVYLNDFLDERVKFNAEFSFELLDMDKLEKEVLYQIDKSTFLFDKEKARSEFMTRIESRRRIAQMGTEISDTTKKMSTRLQGINSLRNNNYHAHVGTYLTLLGDTGQDMNLRIRLAEALGWFTLSRKRDDIVSVCRELANNEKTAPPLRNELLKTVNRLEEYMR